MTKPHIVYVRESGAQPCVYCWSWTPPEGWSAENIDLYLPRGDGWVGLAPPHRACELVVRRYFAELARDRGGWGGAL